MNENKQENLLDNLSSAINTKNEPDILKTIEILCGKVEQVKIQEADTFEELLNGNNENLQTAGAELIAELCKNDENRMVIAKREIVNRLLHFLNSSSPLLIFATIRALGNICYENKEACQLIDKAGIDSILRLLKNDSKTDLTIKICGLLINLISSDSLPKTALNGGILSTIETLLDKYKDSETPLNHLLNITIFLTEYIDDEEFIFTENLVKIIIEIFKKSEIPEICVMCLDILLPLSEKDEFKCILAKEGVCELLFHLIEKYKDKANDEEGRALLKQACDLIVIILTGDACMDLLYNDGKGKTYQNMLVWLDSKDSDLLTTGILAIGNFARKDSYCIQMVKDGIAKKLIDLLKQFSQPSDPCKIQHALLCTLKNLVISKENKPQALKDGIIEVMYPMLKFEDRYIVVFKVLSTFRIVIDGQPNAALNLLSRKDFIERLVYCCYNSDHLGVRGEVPRSFSWLIKNTKSSEPFPMFVSVKDSTKCIVEMISSNHAVMQNEAFIALRILAVGLHNSNSLDPFYTSLCEAALGKNFNFVLNKYGEKWDQPIFENCLSLLENLVDSNEIVKDLKDNEIVDSLEKLNSHNCLDRVQNLLAILRR
ncbi:unnamed protein product [Ceutorhynchus assimilis]|uniref:Rap1 GTPase-GDP dissociation stimulator 1 n=1 Tax=Ceutorhynchus assimilis TaxID=467358 RepID=A0A9N9QPU4_9CUCU|nr:unnamed protein product [Ceutorhynchus assimilis]